MSKLAYGRKLLSEFFLFARQNKVYWVVPLILVLMYAKLVIFGSQMAFPPFIYTTF